MLGSGPIFEAAVQSAALLSLEPLIDTLGVVLVRALGQLLELLVPLEVLKAY